MTLEQKIGQTMIIGFDGTTVDDDLRRVITEQAGVECAGVPSSKRIVFAVLTGG